MYTHFKSSEKLEMKWWPTYQQKVLQNEEEDSRQASISIHRGPLD